MVADHLQDRKVSDKIRLRVRKRVFDRIAYPGLRSEVNHGADVGRSDGLEGGMVGNVELDEAETFALAEQGQSALALADLEVYLSHAEDGLDIDAVAERALALRRDLN